MHPEPSLAPGRLGAAAVGDEEHFFGLSPRWRQGWRAAAQGDSSSDAAPKVGADAQSRSLHVLLRGEQDTNPMFRVRFEFTLSYPTQQIVVLRMVCEGG